MDTEKLLKDATLDEITKVLVRGNGFGSETVWIADYFKDYQYKIVEEKISAYYHNILQYSMEEYFGTLGFKKVKETYYDEIGPSPVTYESLEIDVEKYINIPKNAAIFYENEKDGDKIVTYINKYGNNDITYKIYASEKYQSTYEKWLAFARKKNFYKGKKIDADGKFLRLQNISWDDVILEPKTLETIKGNIEELFLYEDILIANKMSLKRGIILSGPPGTGKTTVAKIVAKNLDATVIYALPSHLGRPEDITRVCEMAKDLSPSILIIEDIDWIAESRSQSYNSGSVIQLMNQLDGLQEFANVVTIATTNDRAKIEGAVKNRPGRFDRIIDVPLPNSDCRVRMFKRFMQKFQHEDMKLEVLAKRSDGLSGSHVEEIVKTAALHAIRARSIDENKLIIIKKEHMLSGLEEVYNANVSSFKDAKGEAKISMIPQDDD